MGAKMQHLAQLNIAKLKYPIEHPAIKDFKDNLDTINQLAEGSAGFVWRLQDDSGNATGISAFDDPMVITNMSVWESVDALKAFTYKSHHVDFVRRRREWFDHMEVYYVLWWVPVGHQPTLVEAKAKLDLLRMQGETVDAFSFRKVFDDAN